MARHSAGILMYRRKAGEPEVLLVHPGGPFWSRRDLGAWSVPKGEYADGEDAAAAAQREFVEETGLSPQGTLVPLGEVRQKGGKIVSGFALEGDLDVAALRSNTFDLEWPPRSGRRQTFPEVDRAEWFALPDAHRKIIPAQRVFLERLADLCR